jgi:hypothetical protein
MQPVMALDSPVLEDKTDSKSRNKQLRNAANLRQEKEELDF